MARYFYRLKGNKPFCTNCDQPLNGHPLLCRPLDHKNSRKNYSLVQTVKKDLEQIVEGVNLYA